MATEIEFQIIPLFHFYNEQRSATSQSKMIAVVTETVLYHV